MVEILVVTKVGHPKYGQIIHVQPAPGVWGRKEDIRQWRKDGRADQDFPGVYTVVQANLSLEEAKTMKANGQPWLTEGRP